MKFYCIPTATHGWEHGYSFGFRIRCGKSIHHDNPDDWMGENPTYHWYLSFYIQFAKRLFGLSFHLEKPYAVVLQRA